MHVNETTEELLENFRSLDADPDAWAEAYWPNFYEQDSIKELIESIEGIAGRSVPNPPTPEPEQFCPKARKVLVLC
jgi:hypothetical protein